jgi:hypothetical protein
VGLFTTNPTKLVLHFSDFSMILYAIYKNQQKHLYYLRITLQQGPWKVLDYYICALALRKDPQGEFSLRNVALGGPAGAAPAEFRPGPAAGPVGEGPGRSTSSPRS